MVKARQTGLILWLWWASCALAATQELSSDDWEKIRALERQRMDAVAQAAPSVVAIYGADRQGGGSGVVIDPSGLALTNHHVIMGAGIQGWGGMADGQLYRWRLIGTDPGGDVAVIQLEGKDRFPYTQLADSDRVKVGDWAIAMGNPFLLTEDQVPTVTMGIVSGVQRYQPGAGANQLVYGNCIQVDSSINPGNSGGPLFDMRADIMGINGRGSFQDRGRVNVGLGYAISANQIKNFLPDLLATKLVEHGSLDANFSNREGKVVCSTINELSSVADAGLALGDRLLKFEGVAIQSANQFTNLICTLPAGWPAELEIEKEDGRRLRLVVRLLGLPYEKPPMPPQPKEEPSPEEKRAWERQREMSELLRAEPGTIRHLEVNRQYVQWLTAQVRLAPQVPDAPVRIIDEIWRGDRRCGRCETTYQPNGALDVVWELEGKSQAFAFDGKQFYQVLDGERQEMTQTEAKLAPPVVQALGVAWANRLAGFDPLGARQLDGSDKAAGAVAARFKLLDEDEDWFYYWVTCRDPARRRDSELVKAAADRDCDASSGIVFEDWGLHEGWLVPQTRRVVKGLDEIEALRLTIQKIEPLPVANPSDLPSKPAGGLR